MSGDPFSKADQPLSEQDGKKLISSLWQENERKGKKLISSLQVLRKS